VQRRSKIKEILHEVIVPSNQLKLTPQEIDAEIIVFDGGDSKKLPIKPPDGVLWHSILFPFIGYMSKMRHNQL
jgi:hypothetical protein